MRTTMRMIVGGAATAALLLSTAPAVAADPPGAPSAPLTGPPPADGRSHTVTLVTGDQVLAAADGTLTYLPAKGRESVGHQRFRDGDTTLVVPSDAIAMLRDGRLDRRLFDVAGLIGDGYADRAELPLIVSGGAVARSLAADDARLESIGATASVVPASELTALWDSMGAVGARSAGDTWIRLDGKSRVVLDASVPQVGAPAAWEAGFDGSGVTVAVLDSGYDPTHPDLADRVAAAENFADSPDAVDRHGHGTHVASIVAGSGAASAGTYKGVAPGAKLIVGKVCSDDGWCYESDLIEGMEWAAAQGAAAVNLSIGGTPYEGDPVVEALERLTAETGTLFVVAAGNNGGPDSIDSPGVAPSALTVGSVTKSDELSDFSSQGPAFDDSMKPDLVAPGSAITAAGAAGTGPDGEYYATHDGTSMATPHVTGAIALLKQRHPDWTAERLKDALVGSAKGLDALGPFQEGAGRLDVARGVSQDVHGNGPVSFGLFGFPQDQETAVEKVVYTNDGAADVTLTVSLTGAEGFAVDRPQVTVPAGGTAAVSVSYDPDPSRDYGDHAAELVATDGTAIVRTAMSASTEPELYTVDFPATVVDGESLLSTDVSYWNLDTGDRGFAWDHRADGTPYARLTPGHYAFSAAVMTDDGGELPIATFTDVSADVSAATGDFPLVLDAAAAGDVTTDVTFTEGEELEFASFDLAVGAGDDPHSGIGAGLLGPFLPRLLPGSSGLPVHFELWQLYGGDEGEYYLAETREGRLPDGLALSYAQSDLGAVDHVIEAQTSRTSTAYLGSGRGGTVGIARPAPGTYRIHYTPGEWTSSFGFGAVDDTEDQNRRHQVSAGQTSTMRWNRAPLGVGFSSDLGVSRSSRGYLYVDLGMFSGPDADTYYSTSSPDSRLTFTANGEMVLDQPYYFTNRFDIPAGLAGDFVLTCEMKRDVSWSDIGTRSSVEFRFTQGAADGLSGAVANLVRLNASGVRDGHALARLPQVVALTVEHNRPDQAATKTLGFEVSYDDGQTWTTVPVARFGETGMAVLRHPAGATAVSTRLTTVDEEGNSSVQTTIRSYGLK